MDYKVNCEKCGNPMHQIGPFASNKPEGQPSEKWDGFFDFECINDKCIDLGQIIKIKLP